MKKAIWKYPLKIQADPQNHNVPIGARFLSCQIDNKTGEPAVWLLVNPNEQQMEQWSFGIAGTGHSIELAPGVTFMGSVQTGAYVWHIFGAKV